MTAQDYFSARPITINSNASYAAASASLRSGKHERSTSAESMSSIRSFLRPWCPDITTPPSSRAVSFSSWTRFKATADTTPPGELKASVLCEASGTTPSYDPPASEWTFLGANQPVYEFQPGAKKSEHRRQKSSKSWTTASSTNGDTQAITFEKQPIKRVSTPSQLTALLKSSSPVGNQGAATATMNRFGLGGIRCEDLPSAFESDEEEDEE
ncbi:hypothetical protein FB567DRAFT_517132 [Paraphoma chrysanthemicola]|uniref:Uncharacterized protein n=1 Tax=Paraphoma chrysanthemicola TaxID=798071 RepID=A0A8K0RDK5_9PLEO|nr:hypothetical protein FB567DRAFT_517132 [Paraphoma chrysanthemicola]